jgi:hypothetical protein
MHSTVLGDCQKYGETVRSLAEEINENGEERLVFKASFITQWKILPSICTLR